MWYGSSCKLYKQVGSCTFNARLFSLSKGCVIRAFLSPPLNLAPPSAPLFITAPLPLFWVCVCVSLKATLSTGAAGMLDHG